jgi:hypothetical protein
MERYTFDVATALHDDVKRGVVVSRLSRVTISAEDFPDWRVAAQVAGCMAAGIHGGMPTSIDPII